MGWNRECGFTKISLQSHIYLAIDRAKKPQGTSSYLNLKLHITTGQIEMYFEGKNAPKI